jgi:hypothetical protein
MIGRKTPWTPDANWEQGKYKKLPVHDEHQRPYVADFINNALLFNEDCLLARPGKVIITEGVTDCLALMQLGLPTVSPVTVRIRAADWERLIPKLRGVETVYICQDNELSQAGLKGALQTARTLAEHKIDTRLVTLPLSETQISARQELTERFGLTASVGPKELAKLLAGRPPRKSRRPRRFSPPPRSTSTITLPPGIPGRISNACSPSQHAHRVRRALAARGR